MFKSKTLTTTPKPAVNTLNSFAIVMPDDAAPILKARLFSTLMHHLYDVGNPHDLNTRHVIDLHDLFTKDDRPEEHYFIVDGIQYELLKRFVKAERVMAGTSRPRLSKLIFNADYWILLGELLTQLEHPTLLRPLSFFA